MKPNAKYFAPFFIVLSVAFSILLFMGILYIRNGGISSMAQYFGQPLGPSPHNYKVNHKRYAHFESQFSAQTLSEFNPPSADACPKRFIASSGYAQLNNNIYSLVGGIVLGAYFNRTLIFSSTYPLANLFDFRQYCVTFEPLPPGLDQTEVGKRPVRTYVINQEDLSLTNYQSFEVERIALDTRWFEGNPESPRLSTVARMIPGRELADPLIYVNLLFFTTMSKKLYVDIIGRIPFHPNIVKVGDAFIERNFGKEPFLGVHARLFDGGCWALARQMEHSVRSEYENMCIMSYEWVAARLSEHYKKNIDELQIFYASDRQDLKRDQQWQSRSNVHFYDGENSIAVDMYILSRSSWFVGNPLSTFAVNVACFREARGLHFSTNMFPDYDGMKFPVGTLE